MRNIFFRRGDKGLTPLLPLQKLPRPKRLPRLRMDKEDLIVTIACGVTAAIVLGLAILGYVEAYY